MNQRIDRSRAFFRGSTGALLLLFFLGSSRAALAQAPDSLADTVFSFDVYAQMADHDRFIYHRWLKADGTYVTLTSDIIHTAGNLDLGPLNLGAGNWTYFRDSSTAGRIVFTDTSSRGSSDSYGLTFSNPTSGSIVNLLGGISGALYGIGTFSLRPSQFGVGPVNLSTRTFLSANGATIAGFVIGGTVSRYVLFRAVGPGLTSFGLTNTAANPGISVNNSTGPVASAPNWSATTFTTAMYQNLFAIFGAFPLNPGQGDACLLLELPPSAYTAQMTAAGGGNALIEVYFLP